MQGGVEYLRMGDHVVEFSRVSSNYILIFGGSFALLIRSFTSHTRVRCNATMCDSLFA